MTFATSLRTAARTLIETFGNTASVYTYSAATKSENEEGDVTVSDWKTAVSIKVADGNNLQAELSRGTMGMEQIGDDDKIIKDTAVVAVNDRITVNSVEFRIESLRPIRTQDTLVAQIINVSRVTDTTNW